MSAGFTSLLTQPDSASFGIGLPSSFEWSFQVSSCPQYPSRASFSMAPPAAALPAAFSASSSPRAGEMQTTVMPRARSTRHWRIRDDVVDMGPPRIEDESTPDRAGTAQNRTPYQWQPEAGPVRIG